MHLKFKDMGPYERKAERERFETQRHRMEDSVETGPEIIVMCLDVKECQEFLATIRN